MDVQTRARGALLGMAVGEALGAPLEGLTQKEIEEKVERITGYLDPHGLQPEHRASQLRRGVYEDDTQTAVAACEILIRNQGWSVDGLRDRMSELGQQIPGKQFGCYRRPHRNLRTAVRRMLNGMSWQECGINSAGASGVSRGVPLGVWFRDDHEAMVRAAVESTLLTHRDPRPCAATASIAAVVAELVKLGDAAPNPVELAAAAMKAAKAAEQLVVDEFAELLFEGHESYGSQFSDTLDAMKELLEFDLEPALARIVELATDRASRPITMATKGFCLTAVPAALYFFLTGLDNFPDTVVDTIAEGGSSDTLGCLVGAMAGALHGPNGIPPRWREGLRNGDQIELRGALIAGESDRSQLAPLLLMEAQLTPKAGDQKKRTPRPSQGGPGGRRPLRGGPPRGGGGGRPGGGGRGGPPRGGGGGRGRPPHGRPGGPAREGDGRPSRGGRPMGRPGGGGYGGRPGGGRPGGGRPGGPRPGGGRPGGGRPRPDGPGGRYGDRPRPEGGDGRFGGGDRPHRGDGRPGGRGPRRPDDRGERPPEDGRGEARRPDEDRPPRRPPESTDGGE